MNKVTDHRNDPWNQGVEKIEINKKSLFVRLFVLIGFLLKAAIALFVGLVKLWALIDDGRKEKDPTISREEAISRSYAMYGDGLSADRYIEESKY